MEVPLPLLCVQVKFTGNNIIWAFCRCTAAHALSSRLGAACLSNWPAARPPARRAARCAPLARSASHITALLRGACRLPPVAFAC